MNEHGQAFFAHLSALRERNPGALAVLRRSLGFAPGAYPPAYPYVERFAGDSNPHRLALYVTAGLFALYPKLGADSLAYALGTLMQRRGSDSIERRFIALLDADAENLSIYLRQVVSLLRADELGFDHAMLLTDIAVWLNPYTTERRDAVRQMWARDFYRALMHGDRQQEADLTPNEA